MLYVRLLRWPLDKIMGAFFVQNCVIPRTAAINRLRLRRGLTREEMRREIGFAAATMSNISQGRFVSLRTMRRLAKALDVDVAKIIRIPREAA
jgi:transcriptional regulator with XRE-family HTH domain